MRRFTRTRVAVLAAAVATSSLALSPASAAEFADSCVDGPAATASAAAPHVWDAAGDQLATSVHAERSDIRSGWIGVNGNGGFTANIQVTNLAMHPVNQSFLFSYTGALGEHFVRAQAGAAGNWIYGTGHLDTTQTPQRQVNDGPTTGKVDAAAGVITIDLPASAIPPKSTDGTAVTMPLIGIRSQFLIGTEVSGGLLLRVDEATDVCEAELYPAEEPPAEEPPAEEPPAEEPSPAPAP
ncbi:MAG: hypothetical protein M3O86_04370 [Actinomycetota bacterium]|nr:hypothetical protein [Actinomycetota bacterium]